MHFALNLGSSICKALQQEYEIVQVLSNIIKYWNY